MDFSGCPRNRKMYAGSERKIGIDIDGRPYILKFRKLTTFGDLRYNHVSEHIGSKIIRSVGIDCQKTCLGTYFGEEVVALKDFTEDRSFIPFNEIGESTLETDREQFQYSYEDIQEMLNRNGRLSNVHETIESFWNLYIMDAFLGNSDRHGMNWGFLKKNGTYSMAPVFDNGSCLFPQMTDEDEMVRMIGSEELTDERVYRFPTSQIRLDDRKSSYYDVIDSGRFEECNKALLRIFPRIDMETVYGIVDEVDTVTETHRRFYRHILDSRYRKILEPAFRRLEDEV
ncbi:MAG: HipA domain-containing protein [archaeon]|nr:HipA domain-containing protein [archaeon]